MLETPQKKLTAALSGLALLAAANLVAVPQAVAEDSFKIDPRHSVPWFEVEHNGLSLQRGRFTKVSGLIHLDIPARKGGVEFVIDASSIDMGFEAWNKHMRGEDYFNVERYPTITFKSDRLIFDGDKPVAAEGSFTLLGVTKPVRLAVTRFNCAPHPIAKRLACGGEVTATFRRSEFGMTRSIPKVGDEIRIVSPVEAIKD